MSKKRKTTLLDRITRVVVDLVMPPKLHIRQRQRKAGSYWQVCRGREIVRQFSALTTTLEDVQAAYPSAIYTKPKAP